MRDKRLLKLLLSVKKQTKYPDEILIIDGSTNNKTQILLENNNFNNLKYFKVGEDNRGLTRQRNYGINLVNTNSEIICFLDDDIVLTPYYFENLLKTYTIENNVLAVGGYILNNVNWEKEKKNLGKRKFYFDGWMRNEPARFKIRRFFGLLPDTNPGFFSTFAHGRSVGFLPPSGKTYEVEQIMGGASSYRKEVFSKLSFSNYFEGYGLYEDVDFSLRLAKRGELYVNTLAQLYHYHDASGRPNKFNYGKMVVRNGWYVWRIKYPKPSLKARIMWNVTSFLLTCIRLTNVITTKKRGEALTESLGRISGWFSLLFTKPHIGK